MTMTLAHSAPNNMVPPAPQLAISAVPTTGEVLPLEILQERESGVVTELVGDDQQIHRLKELGLREGVRVCMVKRGEPCLIGINGQRLSLRLDPTLMILVELSDQPCS